MLRTISLRPTAHSLNFHRIHQRMSVSSSAPSFGGYFITPKQLDTALKSKPKGLVPVSGAWFMPNDPNSRTGHGSFVKSHIASSRFFDLDAIADKSSPYPHMLPDAKAFSSHMSRLGINDTDTVIVYDSPENGLFSAPRVAWTFRVFGHKGPIHVLNNYKQWVEQGYPSTSGEQEAFEATDYKAQALDESLVTDFDAVRELAQGNIASGTEKQGSTVILDARSQGRWSGKDPEPRKGLSSGHIPGSISVPFTDVLDPQTKTMKSPAELKTYFEGLGVTGDKPIVASCGTGVTAAVVEAALFEAGIADGRSQVYDGSWTEWAQRATEAEGLIVKSA